MSRVLGAVALAAFVLALAVPLMGQTTSPPAAGSPPSFISLAELQQFYADKIKKLREAVEAERFASLEAFLKKAPASEREQTLLAMIQSAATLDRNAQVLRLSEEYLKASSKGPDAWAVRQMRFAALIADGRVQQAEAEWEKAAASVDMEAWQQTFDAAIQISDALIEDGRANQAGALYKLLRSKFSFVSNLAQVLDPREAALKWIGKTPPTLQGNDLQGHPVDLSQYKGKVVLIDFWATWCQPCIMALPELIQTYKTYHKTGFEIVGISLDQDREALTRFLQAQPIPWPILFDGKAWMNPNARRYDVTAIPATFLVDRSGKIVMAGTPTNGYGPVVKRLLQSSSEKNR